MGGARCGASADGDRTAQTISSLHLAPPSKRGWSHVVTTSRGGLHDIGAPQAMTIPNSSLVRVHGVTKSFRRGSEEIQVLSNLDLVVRRGEFLALMGPSGSG